MHNWGVYEFIDHHPSLGHIAAWQVFKRLQVSTASTKYVCSTKNELLFNTINYNTVFSASRPLFLIDLTSV